MFKEQPDILWGLIASMYIGNVMLLILNLPLVRLWVQFLKIPYRILAPVILIFCFIGAFSLRNNFFDLWTACIFGFLGYFMKKLDIPATPMVLCLILGANIESLYRQSLTMSAGSMAVFVRGPFSVAMIGLIVLPLWSSVYGSVPESANWETTVIEGCLQSIRKLGEN